MTTRPDVSWLRAEGRSDLQLAGTAANDSVNKSFIYKVKHARETRTGIERLLGQEYGPEIVALLLLVVDISAIAAAFVVFWHVLSIFSLDMTMSRADIIAVLVQFSFLSVVWFIAFGTYRIRHSTHNSFTLGKAAAIIAVSVLFCVFINFSNSAPQMPVFFMLVVFGFFILLILSLTRLLMCKPRAVLINSVMNRRTILYGDAPAIAHLLKKLDRTKHHFGFVGVLYASDDGSADTRRASHSFLPLVSSLDELCSRVWRNDVDALIIAVSAEHRPDVARIIDTFAALNIEIHVANDLPELDGYVDPHAVPPTTCVIGLPVSGWGALAKRTFDMVSAATLLIVTFPLLLLIAAAIVLETRGGPFFCQDRIGYRGARFRIWKFRTMHSAPHSVDARGGVQQATKHDARVTRVGAFLRRTSIDELPQLINVLCGHMSLVGPRPHAPKTLAAGVPFEDLVACYSARHRVRPGITGLAQVRGLRGETTTEAQVRARVASDFEYIRAWSLRLDLHILVKTVFVVLSMRNAH